MRLVLREYLALQKESGELDVLIPDLLLNMGLQPLNRAGSGSRQYGVDVPAVGTDPRDGVRKLVLVTAKQGDIDRKTWNSGLPADVLPSLDEILNIYLRSHVEPSHQGLPVLVVLATGGDMDEQVRTDWTAYTDNHTGTVSRGGADYEVAFEFWGGDKLAALIEDHLVDEYLFPAPDPKDPGAPDVRDVMRRTLALAGDANFDLGPYQALVRATLDPTRLTDVGKRRRALRSLRLTVRVLYRWCEREGNLRPALLAAEYVLLRVWHFVAEQDLTSSRRAERPELGRLYETWRDVLYAYLDVLRPHCETPHGLFGYSAAEDIEYPLRVFDLLGHLALAGLDELFLGQIALATLPPVPSNEVQDTGDAETAGGLVTDDDDSDDASADRAAHLAHVEGRFKNADAIANRICGVIVHNPAALTPPFDDNVVEVALVLTLLTATGHEDDARAWADQLAQTMGFAWTHMPARAPTYAGSYEDRADALLGADDPEFPSSTVLAVLAEWAVVLDDPALYVVVRGVIRRQLTHVNLQTWVPTDETDPALYAGPAIDTGHMRTSIVLPESLDEFAAQVRRDAAATDEAVQTYSADAYGLPVVSLIASRQFRTPPRPSLWRVLTPSGG
jgi:hypothetical protein